MGGGCNGRRWRGGGEEGEGGVGGLVDLGVVPQVTRGREGAGTLGAGVRLVLE